jgi:hypothetical protein
MILAALILGLVGGLLVLAFLAPPLRTFVSFVVSEVQMPELQKTKIHKGHHGELARPPARRPIPGQDFSS